MPGHYIVYEDSLNDAHSSDSCAVVDNSPADGGYCTTKAELGS
jgi:hypothetical protein